jgi:hypothetical protein
VAVQPMPTLRLALGALSTPIKKVQQQLVARRVN